MLIGAVSGFGATQISGSVWIGILAALICAAAFGALFALLVVGLKLNQIVTGLALHHPWAAAFPAFFGKPFVGQAPVDVVPKVAFGPLAELPGIGKALFSHDVLVYLRPADDSAHRTLHHPNTPRPGPSRLG